MAELSGNQGLDISRITHLRIVDVVGAVSGGTASLDSLGNVINDPWPTNFQTSGFDLDAVGVLHAAPDPWNAWLDDNFEAAQRTDAEITGPDADPDGDGKCNLVEYACGFLPNTPEPQPALIIRHTTGISALEYRQRTDRDARSWQRLTDSGAELVPGAVASSGAPLTTYTVTPAADAPRGLFRLKIVR